MLLIVFIWVVVVSSHVVIVVDRCMSFDYVCVGVFCVLFCVFVCDLCLCVLMFVVCYALLMFCVSYVFCFVLFLFCCFHFDYDC